MGSTVNPDFEFQDAQAMSWREAFPRTLGCVFFEVEGSGLDKGIHICNLRRCRYIYTIYIYICIYIYMYMYIPTERKKEGPSGGWGKQW